MEKSNRIESILKTIEETGLSFEDIMLLVFKLLDKVFSKPTTQKELEKRDKTFMKMVDSILAKHYTGRQAANFIGSLGERLLKRHPELVEQISNYIT